MRMAPAPFPPGTRKEDFLIHEAAHVVAAWQLGRAVTSVEFDHVTWIGSTYVRLATSALKKDDTSDYARELAEDDVLILHAGMAAQRTFNYEGTIRYRPRGDLDTVLATLVRFENDRALLLAWSTYLAERSLALVRQPETWRRIEEVARYLARRSRVSSRQLAALRARMFREERTKEASA